MTTCCAKGCVTPIADVYLMCTKHWFTVPPNIKDAVSLRLYGWKARETAKKYLLDNWVNVNTSLIP